MKRILITILVVFGVVCSVFSQTITDPRNIIHIGSNTFRGVLIGNGTNLTDLNLNPSLTQTVDLAKTALQVDNYRLDWFTWTTNYTHLEDYGDIRDIPWISIDNYVGPATATVVHIPAYIGELPVVKIGASAFHSKYSGLRDAAAIYIPETVTNIDESAFQNCGPGASSAGPNMDFYFYGNASTYGSGAFSDTPCVFHYLQGATGFTPTYYGKIPVIWGRELNAEQQAVVTPAIIVNLFTNNITKEVINSFPGGEGVLVLTNNTFLTFSGFATNDAGSWAISVTGTNTVAVDSGIIDGWGALVWTNSLSVPNDLLFRKKSGSMVIGVR